MQQFINIIFFSMLLGMFGCKGKTSEDIVFEKFKTQITKHGMKIDSVDKTGLIYISQGELTLKISLDNVRKDYKRDKDEKYISDFVQTMVSYSVEIPSEWTKAKNDIYISLFPNDIEFNDFVHHKITDEFSKVYVHSGENKFSWISTDDLRKWNITETELDSQANRNADNLLSKTTISYDTIENRKLGLIEAEHVTLKAAVLFAPAMKEKVKKDFSFPFYAVIPVRDFCYIFSEKDFNFFSERLGKVVVDEYEKSGYPITTEILKFSDKGVEAVGKYPIK